MRKIRASRRGAIGSTVAGRTGPVETVEVGGGGMADGGADGVGVVCAGVGTGEDIQALAGVRPWAGAGMDPVAAGRGGVPCGMIAGVGRREEAGVEAAVAPGRVGVAAGRSGVVRAGVVRPGQLR